MSSKVSFRGRGLCKVRSFRLDAKPRQPMRGEGWLGSAGNWSTGAFHVEQGAETAQEAEEEVVEDERLESLGLRVTLMTCDGDGSAFLSNFKDGVCQFQSMYVAFPKYLVLENTWQLVELKMNGKMQRSTPLHVRSQPRPAAHNFLK
jgi:hypothetical protein